MDLEFEVSFGVKVSFEVSFVSTFNFNGEFIGDNNNNSSTPINRPLTPNTPTILQIKQNQTNSKNKKLTSKLTSNSRSVINGRRFRYRAKASLGSERIPFFRFEVDYYNSRRYKRIGDSKRQSQ